MNTLAIRSTDEGEYIVEGWLVPFTSPFRGNKDLYDTYFDASTDYQLGYYSTRPLLYHHGQDVDAGVSPVGTIRSLEIRDMGVWMEAQLDKKSQFFEALRTMVAAGELWLSSGTIDYLAQLDTRSGHVRTWPIAEGSLTPVPANLHATCSGRSVVEACRSAGLALEQLEAQLTDHEDAAIVTLEAFRATLGDDWRELSTADDETPTVPATRAAAGSDPVDTERSFEDIRDDITDMLNPIASSPYDDMGGHYSSVIATFPDYVIVSRYCNSYPSCCDDDPSYWRIAYTLDATNEPVLGESTQMEKVFVPVQTARAAIAPLSLEALHVARRAVAFVQRTRDLIERREEEGRPLSTSNARAIAEAAKALGAAVDEARTIQTRSEEIATAAARAAQAITPETQLEIDVLDLEAFAAAI